VYNPRTTLKTLTETKPTTTLVQYKEEKMISEPKELRENKTLCEKQQTQHENQYKQRTHNTEAYNRVSVFYFFILGFVVSKSVERRRTKTKKETTS
jgi:hypothetical protein